MKNSVSDWVFGTTLFALMQLFVNFTLFGFPPAPYSTFFMGAANEVTGDLWQPLEENVSRNIDLLFAPFVGVVYVFYRQGFFNPGKSGGFVFFGVFAYVLMAVFKQHHYTFWFLILVSGCIALYVKPPDSLKVVFSICVLIGWFNWGAQGNGIGLIPWLGYSLLMIFPTLLVLVVRAIFKGFAIGTKTPH